MKNQNRKDRRKKASFKLFMKSTLLIFLLLILAGAYIIHQTYQAANDSYVELAREKSDYRPTKVSISRDPISILLLGIEDYADGIGQGRSDTVILATFNPEESSMNLVTIPRDTMVSIPDRGVEDKINHAYAFGGYDYTINAVEQFLEVPVDYFAAVDFDGFKNIVDIVGGIEVDVPFDFEQNSDDRVAEKLQFYEGPMEIDGRHALAYARMRMADPRGDIGRNERQQEVIQALVDELTSAGILLNIDDVVREVGHNVTTNLRIRDTLPLARNYAKMDDIEIHHKPVETTTKVIDGIYYEIPKEEELKDLKNALMNHLELNNIRTSRLQ
ncbi:LCP family protein [Salisediminibacterium beveridgei]|uniref:Cell envelope-associated transcriptional attenuator LytR-CpsA-Psr, subfamily F2 n=1 Tax=Salisediminibacterium beveridgei TaxID=632773 RepID=A0A1D7QRR6_9BACI|nr:LCP family protein [Salisediminibacterium beveridgei]AOM81698.1 Cell envelope-associated transcriptional attenuator LytR-CpsA-Psr, subfamily F2 [Salisediminibacterium beveridgei]